MAGFRTHVTVSSVLGVGYGAAAYWWYDLPPETCGLAAALCSASGMLPDLDSDSGRPLREMITFTASVVPMLLIHRFQEWGLSHDSIVLAGVIVYCFVRFVVSGWLKRLTVHRGMFHSLPAALIAGELAFLLCESETLEIRYFKAGAVVLGFMSHLVLDEIWSVQIQRGRMRLKSSFGTAVKLWGDATGPNVLTYGLVAVLTFLAVNDPRWMHDEFRGFPSPAEQAEHIAGLENQSTPR